MKRSIDSILSALMISGAILFACATASAQGSEKGLSDLDQSSQATSFPRTPEEIEPWWKAGKTLPLETAALFPLPEINVDDDRGLNLLIDMAHKCDFFLLWNLGPQLHRRGIRTAGSHATLDTVLEKGATCRVRIPVGQKMHPFAWWPAPCFNVVLTEGAAHYPA